MRSERREDGRSRIQVRLDGGTVWLTQRLLADLYQVSVPTINEHVGNIFDDEELAPAATLRQFRRVQPEGKREVTPDATRVRKQVLACNERPRRAEAIEEAGSRGLSEPPPAG